MKKNLLLCNLEDFEKYMGKPLASYQPSKEEMYVKAQHQLAKKNQRKKENQSKMNAQLTNTDFKLKQGILQIIKKKHTDIDYTAISKVYDIAIIQKIDIDKYPEDIIDMYQAEFILKPEMIEEIKVQPIIKRYKSVKTSAEFEESKSSILFNYKHEMSDEEKDEFFALLVDSKQVVQDEVIKVMIPMQKSPEVIIRMMKSNL